MTLSRPIVRGPLRQAWLSMRQPGPIRTAPSMIAYGPTWTSGAISTSGAITAVGWIRSEIATDIAHLLLHRRFQGGHPVPLSPGFLRIGGGITPRPPGWPDHDRERIESAILNHGIGRKSIHP